MGRPKGVLMGPEFKAKRLELNLTQRELAEKAGVPVRSVQRAEAGSRVSPSTRAWIAGALGIEAAAKAGPVLASGSIDEAAASTQSDGPPEDGEPSGPAVSPEPRGLHVGVAVAYFGPGHEWSEAALAVKLRNYGPAPIHDVSIRLPLDNGWNCFFAYDAFRRPIFTKPLGIGEGREIFLDGQEVLDAHAERPIVTVVAGDGAQVEVEANREEFAQCLHNLRLFMFRAS